MFFFGIRKVAAALQDEITLLLTGGCDAESISTFGNAITNAVPSCDRKNLI